MVRFLADCNVGRLARWLRVLGYDAEYEPSLPDRGVVARAVAEGRVLLTRDADMMRRRIIVQGGLPAVLLRGDAVQDQLVQVVRELGLDATRALTRCLECNLDLEPRSRSTVRDRLPPHVQATQHRFSECPGCRRVYWPGSHWDRMQRRIAALVP